LRFGTPVWVDRELAGGEPLVFADKAHHTLIYTSHEGTTHLYQPGLVSGATLEFGTNYRNQVNLWTSTDNGVDVDARQLARRLRVAAGGGHRLLPSTSPKAQTVDVVGRPIANNNMESTITSAASARTARPASPPVRTGGWATSSPKRSTSAAACWSPQATRRKRTRSPAAHVRRRCRSSSGRCRGRG
jgi:hypothetical protein